MTIDGANNNPPKSIEEYKELAKTIDYNGDAKKIKETVSVFINGACDAAEEISADGEVTNDEAKQISSWLSIISTIKTNLFNNPLMKEVVNKLQELREILLDLKDLTASQTYEPTETDNQYAYLDKKADDLLDIAIKNRDQRNNSAKAHAFNPYAVQIEEDLSNFDLDNIIKTYYVVESTPRGIFKVFKYDELINWSASKLKAKSISQSDYNYLTKDAFIMKSNMQEEQAANNNNDDNENVETADNNTEEFWGKLETTMKENGHSHDGVADLMILGYTREEAEAILAKKKS